MDEAAPKRKTEKIRVRIETARYSIVGTVHPPAKAYRSRLSDLLNQKEAVFLPVTDAEAYRHDNLSQPEFTASFLALNLNSVDMVRPLDD